MSSFSCTTGVQSIPQLTGPLKNPYLHGTNISESWKLGRNFGSDPNSYTPIKLTQGAIAAHCLLAPSSI